MQNVLVPISTNSDTRWAAEPAIARYQKPVRTHRLNVQPPPLQMMRFFGGADLRDFRRDAGMRVLESANPSLDGRACRTGTIRTPRSRASNPI